jgi:serine/threonine-protein kinase
MVAPRPLAGRYAFTTRIRGTQRTIIWLARDQTAGTTVVASVLPGPRAAGLESAIGVGHPHAASILAVVDSPPRDEVPGDEPVPSDAQVVVAEYVEGRSLQQRLEAGPIGVANAVEWAASIAAALAALHDAGAVHGAVSPRAILAVRPAPAVIPVLTHLLVPTSGAYCSPERVTGAGPSEADDTWALAATLYTALCRQAPFLGASRTELARAIVAAAPPPLTGLDPDLCALVSRALSPKPADRLTGAREFGAALRAWMEQTGTESTSDFAPVAALVGPSEPPPNVGDLSLVAAFEQPNSAKATEPLRIDPALLRVRPAEAAFDGEPRTEAAGSSGTASDALAAKPSPEPALGAPRAARAAAPAPSPPPTLTPTPSPAPTARTLTPTPGPAPTAGAAPPGGAAPRRSPLALATAALAIVFASGGAGILVERLHRSPRAPGAEARPKPGSGEVLSPLPLAMTASAPLAAGSASAASAGAVSPTTLPSAGARSAAAWDTAPAEALSASPPTDASACLRATLAPGTLPATGDLGYVCTGGDMWGIARRFDLQIAKHGTGPGMVLWAHLGRYDLAAIAALWQRCCPGAPPFTAATPKGVCEALPGALARVGADPSTTNIDQYAAAVDCFISRGVRYPAEWWDRVGANDSRGYFEKYLATLGARR